MEAQDKAADLRQATHNALVKAGFKPKGQKHDSEINERTWFWLYETPDGQTYSSKHKTLIHAVLKPLGWRRVSNVANYDFDNKQGHDVIGFNGRSSKQIRLEFVESMFKPCISDTEYDSIEPFTWVVVQWIGSRDTVFLLTRPGNKVKGRVVDWEGIDVAKHRQRDSRGRQLPWPQLEAETIDQTQIIRVIGRLEMPPMPADIEEEQLRASQEA